MGWLVPGAAFGSGVAINFNSPAQKALAGFTGGGASTSLYRLSNPSNKLIPFLIGGTGGLLGALLTHYRANANTSYNRAAKKLGLTTKELEILNALSAGGGLFGGWGAKAFDNRGGEEPFSLSGGAIRGAISGLIPSPALIATVGEPMPHIGFGPASGGVWGALNSYGLENLLAKKRNA